MLLPATRPRTRPSQPGDRRQSGQRRGQQRHHGHDQHRRHRLAHPPPEPRIAVPITSISGEQFFQRGDTNVGDTLNDLPQLRSTFSQQNPGLGIGIAGLNLLDLRGLGTDRTLVLVNGRRHVAADILNNAVSPDVNTIPNDLIERVDIVTGGNSAVYGSDAIAGVVNFVLRATSTGVQVRGQAGVSEQGFGGNQYVRRCSARISPTAAATSRSTANMRTRTAFSASDIPGSASNDRLRLVGRSVH